MANALMTIEADTAAVLRLLGRVPKSVEVRLKAVAQESARRVEMEARRRVPIATGRLHTSIQTQEGKTFTGYVVGTFLEPRKGLSLHTMKRSGRKHTQRVTQDNLPIWIEKGTAPRGYADAQPFMDVSAQLEQGPHLRRVREALEDELEGLGGS